MRISHVLILLVLLGVAFVSCKQDAASAAAEVKKEQEDALKALDKSFAELKASSTEVVDFRILKDALPEKLQGMDRVSHNGQKTGIAGLNISTADAEYREGDKTISITLLDSGGFGAALAGLAEWSQLEMDKETDQGYERTTMIDGKRAYEKFDRTAKTGEIAMIAADRFLVNVKGTNITEEDLRAAVSKIQLKG